MQYRFSNLDNELKTIQLEQQIFENSKLIIKRKKQNIIYLKHPTLTINNLLTKITNKAIINTNEIKNSKYYYINPYIIDDSIDEYDEYSYDDELTKEEYFDILLEELSIYYYVYKLPEFDVSIKKLKHFIYTLYDYLEEKECENTKEIITTINRYVLAEALVKEKTKIVILDYINMLKYLLLYGFSYEDTSILEQKLHCEKIINFQKYKKKI